jgi:integrase/recombinase XerD
MAWRSLFQKNVQASLFLLLIILLLCMTSIVNQFKNYLYQLGYSEGSQYMLPACVQEFLEQQQITDISYVEQQRVTAFYEWLHVRPLKRGNGALSESMIGHYMNALRTFFSWAEITGQIDYNPLSGIKFKRLTRRTREPLSLQEITRLFEAATGLQERALLHIFYSCGLRRSEGEALNIRDIHFKEQLLYVREGKGARRRVVPLTDRVTEELRMYLHEVRLQQQAKVACTGGDLGEAAFMLNQAGTRMKGISYLQLLNRINDKAGITAVTLHHLRHSIATHLLQGGMSMEYVRDFLGHRHLESTQIYAKPNAGQLKLL